MPNMDGWETIQALQRINPNVRIIATSGLLANGTRFAESEIVKAFLSKPFMAEKLLRTLAEVIS